jgi:hypothetical protein
MFANPAINNSARTENLRITPPASRSRAAHHTSLYRDSDEAIPAQNGPNTLFRSYNIRRLLLDYFGWLFGRSQL